MSQGRTPEEMLADPATSPEDLERLPREYHAMVVAHPNCPAELWKDLAAHYPQQAKANPAAALYALEDPNLYSWAAIELEHAGFWIDKLVKNMSIQTGDRWLALCMQHALETMGSGVNAATRQVIHKCEAIREQYVNDEITWEQRQYQIGLRVSGKVSGRHRYKEDLYASLEREDSNISAEDIRSAVAYFLMDGPSGDGLPRDGQDWTEGFNRIYYIEAVWQWKCLVDLLAEGR